MGTNEENADSGNSRQPANISKLMTQVGEATDMLLFFCFFFSGKERQEKQANHFAATARQLQDEMNEQAKKDIKSKGSRPPAESWP